MHSMEYKLRFLLNSVTMKICDIVDCSDPKKLVEHNTLFCNDKRIQGFCTGVSDVTKIPLFGVPLNTKSNIHVVYFCEVAVGDSLFVSSSCANDLPIPSGFGSFITDEDNTNGYLMEHKINLKKYFYVIKDQLRINPIYKITFEYDEETEKRLRGKNICHRCQKENAVVFCPSERADFCKSCDETVHNDNFLKRHERKYFSEVGQRRFICCSQHPTKVVEYYCEGCLEPLCTECKITGSHSSKDKIDHRILPFINACDKLKENVSDGAENLRLSEEKVDVFLDSLKDKVGSFQKNITSVKKQLEKDFKNMMLQLENIESNQRSMLNAFYLDKLVKKAHLNQMVIYPEELDSADLMYNYCNIIEQRKSEKTPSFSHPDIQKIEIQGKTMISAIKNEEQKTGFAPGIDKSVCWRIETMNINTKKSAHNN